MSLSPSAVIAPYAVAFSIEDLILVRSWAEQRALHLTVATDEVLDGAEFEELLIVTPRAGQRGSLTVWRTQTEVFAQMPHGRPRAFATVQALLDSLRPAQRAPWLRLFGFAAC